MSITDSISSRKLLIIWPAMLAAICWIGGFITTIVSSQVIMPKILSVWWPNTTGIVERLSVNHDERGASYIRLVTVKFLVNGTSYTVQESMERTGYSQLLYQQELSVGDSISVHYDPKTPGTNAVLDQEISMRTGMLGQYQYFYWLSQD